MFERMFGVLQGMDSRIQGLEQKIQQQEEVRNARTETINQLMPPDAPAEPPAP